MPNFTKPTSPALQTGNALATGLVRCYPFAAGAGSTLTDYSSYGANASLTAGGAYTWGTDATYGTYVHTNRADQARASAVDTGLPAGTAARSFAFIFRASSVANDYRSMFPFSYGSSGGSTYGAQVSMGASPPAHLRVGTALAGVDGTADVADDTWHVGVITDDGTTARFYLDGVADGTATSPLVGNSTTLTGTSYLLSFTNIAWAHGDVAGVQVWDRTLSSSDVTALQADFWQVIRPATGPTTGTFSGPTSGATGVASSAYTVTLNAAAPSGGTAVALGGTGATFSGAGVSGSTLTIPAGQTVGTFTATRSTDGTTTITPTASGITFTPTNIAYATTTAAATGLTVTGPTSGAVGAGATFTFSPNGAYSGTVTPTMAGLAGAWSPTSLTFSNSAAAQAATFTPSAAGSGTPSATASPTLSVAPAGAFVASAAVSSVTYTSFAYGLPSGTTPTVTIKDAATGATVTPASGGSPVSQGPGAYSLVFTAPAGSYMALWSAGGVTTAEPAAQATAAGAYVCSVSGATTAPAFTLRDQAGTTISTVTPVSLGSGVYAASLPSVSAGTFFGRWNVSGQIILDALHVPGLSTAGVGGGVTYGINGSAILGLA